MKSIHCSPQRSNHFSLLSLVVIALVLLATAIAKPARAAGLLIADGGFGGLLEIKEHDVKLLGISCLLTACDQELYKITASLKKEGLTGVKVIIGGAAMTERVASDIEQKNGILTKFSPDAIAGIRMFEELLK